MGGAVEPDVRHAGVSAAGADAPDVPAPDAAPSDAAALSTDPRLAAHALLRDVADGALADRAAARRFAGLSSRDRRLATELAYGTLRLRGRLDHELAHRVDRPLTDTEPAVLDWLRLGLYQLREMRVPAHAAVDESVEGVRRTVGPRATGFVNGVLRAAARRDRDSLFPSLEEDPAAHLVTWGSHPEWLVRRWLERWPLEQVVRLVELDDTAPDVTVRLLEGDVEAARRAAAAAGLELEPLEGWPRCARLVSGDPSELLSRVAAVVQDPAASAVVDYVGPTERGPVVDACAAPGGKALALAAASPGARPFVAADVRRDRLGRTVEAAARREIGISCVVMDARRPAVRDAGLVLVDAPCTGTGTLRRRPDARWRVGPGRLEALTRLQRDILDGCAEVVAPGGVLVYATCSLEPEENEEQVDDFLSRHPDFDRVPVAPTDGLPSDVVDDRGDLRVLPWQRSTDGAFASRLRRRAA